MGIIWIFPLLFTIQVLTLAFGIISLFFRRKVFSFAPILLTLTTVLLMMYANSFMNTSIYGPPRMSKIYDIQVLGGAYQLGYYLAYPSLVAFLLAFILGEVVRTRTSKAEIFNQHGNRR
jgi:hypothetical protein